MYYAKNLYVDGELKAEITIPSRISCINNYAFYGCTSITSVIVKEGVTEIGNYAFKDCTSLTDVKIPGSLSIIHYEAFDGCTSLNAVHIPDINTWCSIIFESSEANPLSYAKKLYIDGELVTELVIPNGFTTINNYAFYNCNSIISVTIPPSVTEIYDASFYNATGLNAVYITDMAAWCNIDFKSSSSNPLYYAHSLYLNGELANTVVVPDGVTKIGNYAFVNFNSLNTVIIPDSVTEIGAYAFSQCKRLNNVVLGKGVTKIGNYAFYCETYFNLYYMGTQEDLSEIELISLGNDYFTNAYVKYYSATEPAEEQTNYWHYVNGKPTTWSL